MTIDCPQAAGMLKGKVDPWYAEGGVTVICGIGADESDRDEVAMDIAYNNSLYQSSTDVEISRNGA